MLNRKTRPGTLWPVAPMQAPHICSPYVSYLLTVILSLFLSEMHNIVRQPAPRIQEAKPSGLDAHFEYIAAYMLKKTTSGGPPGALRGPSGGSVGAPAGAAPKTPAGGALRAPRARRIFYALYTTGARLPHTPRPIQKTPGERRHGLGLSWKLSWNRNGPVFQEVWALSKYCAICRPVVYIATYF